MNTILQSYDEFFYQASNRIQIFRFKGGFQTKQFLKKPYNPVFTYLPEPIENTMYLDLLKQLRTKIPGSGEDRILAQVLKEKQKDLIKKLELSRATGTSDLTKKSILLYGKPNEKLCAQAEEILSETYKKKKKVNIAVDEVHKQLRAAIASAGVTGWRIKREQMITSASVNLTKKIFKLKKKERMSQAYIDRLKAHEIGVHILRHENGLQQPLKVFSTGLAKSLPTEEGLAVYSEYSQGLLDQQTFRNYAGRVLAIQYALESDFVTTFKQLKKHFPPQVALKLTLRAKRGMDDSSQPGAFTKDCVYLKGFYEVQKYAKRNDLRQLWIGKIGLKDVKRLQDVHQILPPKYLPRYLQSNQ